MDELNFDELKLFARVAALGTLSAVARERDVPVSQVSRSLVRIEKACGARLIHRSTHGLALTAEGETFLSYCERLTGTFEELEGEFATKSRGVSGLVRVAASTVMAQYLLLPSLPGLAVLHPQLRVDLDRLQVVVAAVQQLADRIDRQLHVGRRRRLDGALEAAQDARARRLRFGLGQVHADQAALAPDNGAVADRAFEEREGGWSHPVIVAARWRGIQRQAAGHGRSRA